MSTPPNRAYSVFRIKAVEDAKRIIRGIATTPTLDRVGDIIEPLGVKFANPLPFLWQHQHDKPIGTCEFGMPTAAGIPFVATIANPTTPGALKDRCDEAWQSIELGLVRAVSIGFRPIEYSYVEGGGIHFRETEVFELSAVTVPAQAEAIIESAKSAMSGTRRGIGAGSRATPVVKLSNEPSRPHRVVRLTEKEKLQAQIIGASMVRLARERALGIVRPPVKL